MAPLADEHLHRLAQIAEADREGLFSRKPHLAGYRDRILLTALCQGAALHYVNGTDGVKDLDLYTSTRRIPRSATRTVAAGWRTSATRSTAGTQTITTSWVAVWTCWAAR